MARILRDAFPEIAPEIRRGWQSRAGCTDPDVCGLPLFWLECKTGIKPNIRAAYSQAKRDSKGKGAFPVAVIQDKHARDRLVAIGLSDFIRVLRSAYGHLPPLTCLTQLDLPLVADGE